MFCPSLLTEVLIAEVKDHGPWDSGDESSDPLASSLRSTGYMARRNNPKDSIRDQAVERRLVKARGEEVRIVIKSPGSHVWELGLGQVAQDSFDGDLVPWQL